MSDSLFNSSTKSTAYKNILNKSKENQKVGVGKEEFLARRRLFLEQAQNDNRIKSTSTSKTSIGSSSSSSRTFKKPEPKYSSSSIVNSKSNSYSKLSSYSSSSTTKTSTANKTSSSTIYTKISDNIPKTNGLAGISAPKSNSLKSILSQVNKGNQSVSTDEFRSRRKAFEDAQLNDITQLLPRPLTPSGYSYYGRSSPLLGSDRPWSPASDRPWSPVYERRGSPTPSCDSERSYGTSEVRLPWEKPSQQTKKISSNINSTKNLINDDKKLFSGSVIPGSPTLSATAITSDEPIAIPITKDSTLVDSNYYTTTNTIQANKIAAANNEKLLNEKLQMWYSKVDEEFENDKKNSNVEIVLTHNEE